MTSSAGMMTRPLRAFSLRVSSTVPRLELDTGRPARHVRDLEYHTGELSAGLIIITDFVLRRYGAEVRTDARRLVGRSPSREPLQLGASRTHRIIVERELIRENTMFFNARSKTEPSTFSVPF